MWSMEEALTDEAVSSRPLYAGSRRHDQLVGVPAAAAGDSARQATVADIGT
jgi:hypothetical protein